MSGAANVAIAYPSRTKQRLETRDRIFAAALAEFRRVGVAAAEIENIVRAAEVARGTFYLHFPTKDHVLMELLRRQQHELGERLPSVRLSPRAFLRRATDLMIENAVRERDLYHELFAVVTRHAGEMRTEASALVEALTAFFAAGQERGEVRRDISAFDLTNVFLPGVYGLLQLKLDAPRAELRQALHRVVDVFVRGIAG
ncbi:MAG: TetR/AcrR family transcriptional regulator [Candidatus Binatia bacterium]